MKRRKLSFLAGIFLLASATFAAAPADWARERDDLLKKLLPAVDRREIAKVDEGELVRFAFIHRVTPEGLSAISSEPQGKAFLDELYTDHKRLSDFVYTVEPVDDAKAALLIWSRLWNAEEPGRRAKYGRLMLGIALLFDTDYPTKIGASNTMRDGSIVNHTQVSKDDPKEIKEFEISPGGRYKWYRDHWEAGALLTDVSEFQAWEFKFIVNMYRPDEDLDWALTGLHEKNKEFFDKPKEEVRKEFGHVVYHMVPYIWPWGGNMDRHLSEMIVNGAVCGGQSDFCQAAAQAHGIPAAKQGGPGHGWMAWKRDKTTWDPTGGGGYDARQASFRNDWAERNMSQSRTNHIANDSSLNRWLLLSYVAREVKKADDEKDLLLRAGAMSADNYNDLDNIIARLTDLKASPADWIKLTDGVEKKILTDHPDACYDVLANLWRIEDEKVLPAMPRDQYLSRLAQRRQFMFSKLADRSDLLDLALSHEIAQLAGTKIDPESRLSPLLKQAGTEAQTLAVGRALLAAVKNEPKKTDRHFDQIMRRLADLPPKDVGARAGLQESMQTFVGFGEARKVIPWKIAGAEKSGNWSFALTDLPKANSPVSVRVLFVPKSGSDGLNIEKLSIQSNGTEVSKAEQGLEIRPQNGAVQSRINLAEFDPKGKYTLSLDYKLPGGDNLAGDLYVVVVPNPDWSKATRVGGYGKEMFDAKATKQWKEVEIADLTPAIKSAGPINIEIRYDSYESGSYAWVKLYKNGKEVAADLHAGNSRANDYQRRFLLNLDNFDPKAKYTLRALMWPMDGWGSVWVAE